MSDQPVEQLSSKRAVYSIAGMERAVARKDLIYRATEAGPLTMDVYYPADVAAETMLPAVVFVAGYNDIGYEKMLGRRFKEMAMTVSWCQLVAASGMAAIAYTNRDPVQDLGGLLDHVQRNAPALGVDGQRIGLWACSGSVPLAISALMRGRDRLRCAVFLYGYMLDLDGARGVADAAQSFRFTNPNAGRTMNDLPDDVPIFIVRAGQEQFPNLNESIETFVAKAVTLNRPITFVNHADGPHSFDILQDSPASRAVIQQTLGFLNAQLTPAGS
jgi:acetyl esterase/lipase